ncbi:CheY-like chemotaxis protein [Microvirga lupini]|uniref:CheY-like chemotaxis protein n=1 Tax=Microvirga lupini TaxID=420324 RepID=A0A7W4YVM9_9HYPH|nr:response regulator [Microvirga lupini]MBB3018622.1 CheY-like chemotaxis protein [Microvirga lupini]
MAGSSAGSLSRCRVLVVEDEFYIADDMAAALEKLGAEVVGPVPTQEKALALIASAEPIHAAILDFYLKGETVYPVADALAERGIPFVFATGYDRATVLPEYQAVQRWEKPFNPHDLAQALPVLMRNQ